MDPRPYRRRLVDSLLEQVVREAPAVLITGPRAVGKTTTLARFATSVVRLDRPDEAAAFRDSADSALGTLAPPVLLDEWQHVPAVTGAVKRAVDAGARPGTFLLAASASADLSAEVWPGTGRLIRLRMLPLTERELRGNVAAPGLVDRLLATGPVLPDEPSDPLELPDYLTLIAAGGFAPSAFGTSDIVRTLWLDSYLDQIVSHDIPALGKRPDPTRLRDYLVALAKNTAGLPADNTLARTVGATHPTITSYESLLRQVGISTPAEAWTSNRLKRLSLRRKVYLVDTGLTCAALGVSATDLLQFGDLYGRLLDSFVAMQLRAEAALLTPAVRLRHVRDAQGRHEVDILIDAGRRGLIACEVKSTSAPTVKDAAHIEWLRDEVGDRLRVGIVFHTGPRAFHLTKGTLALPISALWS